MKLKLGNMSTKELVEWFGIASKTFTNNRKKYLAILSNYADYEEVAKGKYRITKIRIEEYSKVGAIVESKVEKVWKPGKWTTATQVANEVYGSDARIYNTIQFDTCSRYTSEWKRKHYGVAFVREGDRGSCISEFRKEVWNNTTNQYEYVELTPEEKEIKKKLLKKYFSTDKEKIAMIRSAYEQGEIDKIEMGEALMFVTGCTKNNYQAFLSELETIIGSTKKATMLEDRVKFTIE